jgi:hypothetical protein
MTETENELAPDATQSDLQATVDDSTPVAQIEAINLGESQSTTNVVPVKEVREPHWYRQDIARRDREMKEMQRQLQQLQSYQPPVQQLHPEEMGYDPYSYANDIRAQIQQDMRLESSEDRFRDKHGDDTFEEVNAWLLSRPDLAVTFAGKRDPWREAHKVFEQEKVVHEVGNDPVAYKERVRQEVLAEMSKGATQGGGLPQRTILPPNSSAQRSASFTPSAGSNGRTPLSSLLSL